MNEAASVVVGDNVRVPFGAVGRGFVADMIVTTRL